MSNKNLNSITKKGFVDTATDGGWTKMLDSSRNRGMLEIHNKSKTGYLQVAYSEEEANAGAFIIIQPLGFKEPLYFVANNEIWIKADNEGADVEVAYWLAESDLLSFD